MQPLNQPLQVDASTLQRFFETWFGDLEEGFVEIRPIPNDKTDAFTFELCKKARTWFRPEGTSKIGNHINYQCSIHPELFYKTSWYFGTCPRNQNRKGTAEYIDVSLGIWADIDNHHADPSDPDYAEEMLRLKQAESTLQLLRDMGFVPAFVIQSGPGVGKHVYFRFTEPQEADTAGRLSFKLAKILGSDTQVAEIARVMRIPGTYHTKTGQAVPVSIIEQNQATYEPEDLEDAFDTIIGRLGISIQEVTKSVYQSDFGWDPVPMEHARHLDRLCPRLHQYLEDPDAVSRNEWLHMATWAKALRGEDEELFHLWSAGYTGYTEKETNQLYRSLTRGPVSCSRFQIEHPMKECEECPLFSMSKNPVTQLRKILGNGRIYGAPSYVEQLQKYAENEAIEKVITDHPEIVEKAKKYERSAFEAWVQQEVAVTSQTVPMADDVSDEDVPVDNVVSIGNAPSTIYEAVRRKVKPIHIVQYFQISLDEKMQANWKGTTFRVGPLTVKVTWDNQIWTLDVLQFFSFCEQMIDTGIFLKPNGKELYKIAKTMNRLFDVGWESERILYLNGLEKVLVVPQGYRVDELGVYKVENEGTEEEQTKLITRFPVVITNVSTDDDGVRYLTLKVRGYKHRNSWNVIDVPAEHVRSTQKIIALANQGLDVSSVNARQMVGYLQAFEGANIIEGTLKDQTRITKTGWVSVDEHVFAPFHVKGEEYLVDLKGGNSSTLEAFEPSGTLEEWKEHISWTRAYPLARLVQAASFAAPLLRLIHQRSFVIYFYGKSGGGKTASQYAAGSVWYDPNVAKATAQDTNTSMEQIFSFSNDLPVVVNEMQLAVNNEKEDYRSKMQHLIYMIAEERGKARSTKNLSLRKPYTWKTIALMSGEQDILSDTANEGAINRCLEIDISCSPERVLPEERENEIKDIYRWTELYHGTAGPAFLKQFHETFVSTKRLEDVKQEIRQIGDKLRSKYPKALPHHTEYMAILAWVDMKVSEWIFGSTSSSALLAAEMMAERVLPYTRTMQELDIGVRAMRLFGDWVRENTAQFLPVDLDEETPFITPKQLYGWLGDEVVHVNQKSFDDFCVKYKLPASVVKQRWKEKNWLILPDNLAEQKKYTNRICVYSKEANKKIRVWVLSVKVTY